MRQLPINAEKERKFKSVLSESFSVRQDSFTPVDRLLDLLQKNTEKDIKLQSQKLSALVSEIDVIQHRNEKHLEYLTRRLEQHPPSA